MAEYIPRLITEYKGKIVPALQKRFAYKNVMEVPKLEKIVVNMGVGEAVQDSKLLDRSMEDMSIVTGQKPCITTSKKAISNFKLRAGNKVGCKVTLRRWRMYEFLDRLISIAVPRIRDFRGLPNRAFDGRGNYNMGLKEQVVFPEIDYDRIDQIRGMNITITTTAKSDEEGLELLTAFGMPFRKADSN